MSSNYEQNKKYVEKYRKEHTSRVTINLRKEEKEEWQRIAEASGKPLATLIRKLISEYAFTNKIK